MNHRLAVPAALLVVAACTSSCESRRPSSAGASASDLAAISRLHDAYVSAHNDADADRMMALFTADAVLMPTDEPSLAGATAIGGHYQEFFDQTPSEIRLRPVETRVAGDWAFERIEMTVTLPGGGGEVLQAQMKHLWILERQGDGSWKIARAIYNLDEDFTEAREQSA